MRPMSERKPLTTPRYRVEQRVIGEAEFIVGFADDQALYHVMLARAAARLVREGTAGEVVAIDQDTEEMVARRDVRTVHGQGRDGSVG